MRLATIIIVLGVLTDLLLYQSTSLIIVNDEYIYHVYAALTTIAAISPTILTIVVNSFNEKYYGFTIKEIVNFRNKNLRLSKIIDISLISILLSTFILAIGLINTLVAILFTLIIVIVSSSQYTWKLITDEQFCIDKVLEEIDSIVEKDNIIEIEYLLKKLFRSLDYSIKTYGILNLDTHLDIIRNTIEKSNITEDLSILIDKELKNTFKTVSISIGFIPAIDKVLNLYNSIWSEYSHYDKREIFSEPLQNIQYLDDEKLSSSTMIEISNGLEKQDDLDDSEKVIILYEYFRNLYFNEIINKRLRNYLLENLIIHLTSYSSLNENNYDSVKQKTLLYIVKDFILTNKETEEAKDILIKISKALDSRSYLQSEKLFETTAIIYLAIYSYSELETETLVKNHRDKIKSLIYAYESSIHTNKISFNIFLKTNFKKIVEALWNLSDQVYRDFSFLEYFPPHSGAKSIVWDKNTGINFAILNYLLSYYEFGLLPYKVINNWDEMENKRIYVNSMLDYFDPDTKTIKESWLDKIKEMSEWIGIRDSLPLATQKKMFEVLNNEMQLIDDNDLPDIPDCLPEVAKINSLLKEQFIKHRHIYGYDDSINFENSKEIHFRPLIANLQYCNTGENISDRLARYFEVFINNQIKKELPQVELNFDLEGVKKLLSQLKENNFNKRNYTYIDDWALSEEVRESEEYKELSEIIENITFQETNLINSNMFFRDDCLHYNIEITKYNHELLTDDECSSYAENFKVGDGLYKLKKAYLNKSKAMEIIKKDYRKELVSFRYNSNLSSDCGIGIGFKYKNI